MTQMKVEYLYHSGSDLDIINAAYASFSKVATQWDATQHPRLMRYLARGMSDKDYESLVTDVSTAGFEHNTSETISDDYTLKIKDLLEQYRHTPTHWSPFAHVSVSLRLKAPIAIHAQFMKHTVGFSHNTTSRRYVSSTPDLFMPNFRKKPEGNIKQGSGISLDEHHQQVTLEQYSKACNYSIELYEQMIKDGIAPEQARLVLPQGVMTEWQTTGSLSAWARLYNQRTDSHAQKEIQELAHMVGEIIKPLYPHAWDALIRS